MAYHAAQRAYLPLTMRNTLSVFIAHITLCIVFLFPIIQGVSTHIPAGDGSNDGYQFLWNLWWVRKVIEGEGSLLYTHHLFAPHGTPLVLHSLSASNGFLSLPIQYMFSDIQGRIIALNILTIGHFALLSSMIHLLCRKLTCSHIISFAAAVLIAYLPYRIHHLHHINLLSSGWMIIALYALITLKEQQYRFLSTAALIVSTTALLYADHEQSLCLGIITIAFCYTYRTLLPWKNLLYAALIIVGLTIPIWIALFSFPPHTYLPTSSEIFSTNLPSLLFPISFKNRGIQHQDPYIESHIGWVFWIFVFLGASKTASYRRIFWGLAILFGILSLGTTIRLGNSIIDLPLPFDLMHNGWLKIARAPVRFLPVSLLFIVLVSAQGWTNRTSWAQWLMLLYVLVVRYPSQIPMESIQIPATVSILAHDTRPYAIWNAKESYTSIQKDMCWQTIHEHPISGGYTARIWKPAHTWKQTITKNSKPIQELGNNGFGLIMTSGSAIPQQWIITPFGQEKPKEE